MSDAFVPFAPLRPANAGAAKAQAFQPAAPASRSALPAAPEPRVLQQPSPAQGAVGAHANHTSGNGPQITLQRDGDRISVIQVRCSCGEVIEIKCAY